MDGLFARGRLDILRSIQDRTYTPLEVYDAWRVNELERLPTAATLAPLKESMEKWIAKKECSPSHRLSLSQSLRYLTRSRSTSTVQDLPALLNSARDSMAGKHPRSFNLARAAAQAFVKSTLKRSHPIYVAITDIEPLPVKPQRTKHPLTPAEYWTIYGKLDTPHKLMFQVMCSTGMGPSEYWGKWEFGKGAALIIHGTKRKGRERTVPAFVPIGGPFREYAAFRRALSEASGGMVKPYDLRRTYANWLESAGIPRTRRRLYMGHGAKDVTDLYEAHEIREFLQDDANKLTDYLFGATGKQHLELVNKA